jgi:hypothetical protein
MGEKVVELKFYPFLCFYAIPPDAAEQPEHILMKMYDAVADTHSKHHAFLQGPPKTSLLVPLKAALNHRDNLLAQLQQATKVEVFTSPGAWFSREEDRGMRIYTFERCAPGATPAPSPYVVVSTVSESSRVNEVESWWPFQCFFDALTTSANWCCTVNPHLMLRVPSSARDAFGLYRIRVSVVESLFANPAPPRRLLVNGRNAEQALEEKDRNFHAGNKRSLKTRLEQQERLVKAARHAAKRRKTQ